MGRFEFKEEPALGTTLYMRRWNGNPTSVLRVTHAAIIKAESPYTRLHVMLEINRPAMKYGLSPKIKQLIEQDRRSKRWGET